MVHCRGIFAPIGEQVCDGSYIAFVMKKVNGPAQAKLGRATAPAVKVAHPPCRPVTLGAPTSFRLIPNVGWGFERMTVLVREESWKWLSQIEGAGDSDLLREVKAFLTKDFEQAFEIIRTQKLLSRSRSLETTTSLCAELENWVKTAPLGKKEQSKLIRHCKLTVGFQSMMSSVRARTETLDIWSLCFPDFAVILIGTLEATNVAFNQRLEQAVASREADFLDLNSRKNWILRGTLDSARLVLNEGRRRCSNCSDFKTGSPTAFVKSLELAHQTAEIMLVWDRYSFARSRVSVTGNEMRVNRPDAHTAVRLGNYRQRMMELDITHRSSAHQRFSVLSEELKKSVSAAEFSVPFDEFLDAPAGRRILERLLDITEVQEKDISDALESLIDLDAEARIGRLKHVYRDLVTVWCYIVRIAIASRIWGELVHSATGEYPKTTITLKRLRETFVGLRELPESSIDKGIRHFSSFIEQKHIVDLFYQPLLRMTEEEILIPASYILNSRFDRNLISIIAREKSDSLAVKGRKPLRKLRALFEKSGFRCLEDIEIRDSGGNLLTDLDLLACRDDDVFFFQSKVLSIPDTPYEYWRVDQTLLSAAFQMDVVLDHTSQVERACQSENPTFNLDDKRISAYLITDVMVHSGFTLKGYEVIDFDYLQQLLRGARLGVFDVIRQEVIATFSEIEGDLPSPEEIRGLISSLSSPKSRPLKGTSERRIELGGWTLIMDARGFV
jgi:hypothetical protein